MSSGSLGHIAGTVTLDINPFKQSSAGLRSAIKANAAALKAEEQAVKAYGNNLNSMKSSYATMNAQMKNYTAQLKDQEATMEKNAKKTSKDADEQKKLTQAYANSVAQVNKTKAAMTQLDGAMQRVNRQIAQQETTWYSASQKLKSFSDAATNAGQKMTSMGSFMTTRVTAPIVAGFGYAAKSAIDFNSEIASISPLLKANGESASQVRGEMVKMSDASKQWAVQYGVSTNSINAGLEEMVKRGYSASQAMGAMPSVLNAAKASGDDFNTVMSVSTSTLEQFGLKSNTTAGMLKNTQRVTDTLTYTANATAAGFQDMGDAMTYVGPTAHAAGISLEETAAAIGLMSNQGIEGSVAGTALRSALTRLMKPSKQNAEGFRELGINVEDFKNHSLTLPEILNKIKNNTQGWTKEQRASAIALAFGTEAQAGMNALVSEGGDALSELTEKTEKAKGSTKAIADEMNETAAAKIERFKESLHVLAINIGDKLIPAIMPLVENLNGLVKKFGEMDDATQKSIIKWGALAAAIGPALLVIGGAARGLGALTSPMAATALGISRIVGASKTGATALGALHAGFSKTAYESGNFAVKAVEAGAGVNKMAGEGTKAVGTFNTLKTGVSGIGTGFTAMAAALGVTTPVMIALTVAAGAAVVGLGVLYETVGKSNQRISRWGTDVGADADRSLRKIKEFSTESSNSLNDFSNNVDGNAKSISNSFKGMSTEIGNLGKDANKALTDSLKDLPDNVKAIVEASVNKQKSSNNKLVNEAKQTSKNISNITKDAASHHRNLTDDENQYILNSQQKMNENEVKLLGLSGKQKKKVMQALNEDARKLTQNQAKDRQYDLDTAMFNEQKAYKEQAANLKTLRKNGVISEKAYNKALKDLRKGNTENLLKQGEAYVKYAKRSGESQEKIENDLKRLGLSYDDVMRHAKNSSDNVATSNSRIADTASKMSKVSKKAGEDWNKMVLDPKTGEIKTNAQETINETAQTEQGWAKLKFELKHAKLTSNARSMIGVAAIESGRWNNMSWKEKQAMIRINGKEEFDNAIKDMKGWDKLTPKEQKLITNAKGTKGLADAIKDMKDWDKLTPKEQKAIIKAKGDEDLANVVKNIKDWDKLTPKQQEAIIRAKGQKELAVAMIDANEWNNMSMKDKMAIVRSKGGQEMIDLLTQTGTWNNLSVKSKEAIVKGKGTGEVVEQIVQLGKWNDLTTEEKSLLVKDEGTQKIIDAMVKTGEWNSLTMDEKNAVVKNKATAELMQSMLDAGTWNSLTLDQKDAIIHDKASANMVNALNQAGLWQNLDMETKDAIVQDKASSPIIASLIQAGKWNDLPVKDKNAIINTGTSALDLAGLITSYGGWNDLPEKQKNLIINDASARQMLIDAGVLVDDYNKKKIPIKKLNADDQDAVRKLKEGQTHITTYNGKQVEVKKLKGDKVDITAKVDQSKASVDTFNNKKANKKDFKGDSTSAVRNGNAAKNAITTWNSLSPVTHWFKTIYQKITKNAKGTDNFEGGLSYVNDESGSIFRELVKLPNGQTFIPAGRNVLLDLPAHSQVIPARETNRLMGGIPQFANGTPGYSKVINTLSKFDYGDSTSSTTSNTTNSNISNSSQNNTFNISVNVTGGENPQDLGSTIAKAIEAEMRQMFNNESMALGGGSIA
ncbi:phage tail tape measure protein [Lactobacillus terrae]|uniref:phage tail tape measure protein n=1 Tax=Lactobacillus terrae TaxID=2269374 RepID=UPI000C1B6DB5|nr:phage tail tape measure protein [Lactobacillus terrae]